MHEYSLMEGILETVVQDLAKRGITSTGAVKALSLKVGVLEIHSVESFRQAFQMLSTGTVLDGCSLDVTVIPPELTCPKCGYAGAVKLDDDAGHMAMPAAECPKCGEVVAVKGGRGVEPVEVVVEE